MLTVEWMSSGTLRQGRIPSAHSHPRASPTPRLERYGTDFALGTDPVPRCVVGDQIEAAPRKRNMEVLPAALLMSPSERMCCIRRTLLRVGCIHKAANSGPSVRPTGAYIVKVRFHRAFDECLCDDANINFQTCYDEAGPQSRALLPVALHQVDVFVQIYLHCGLCTQPVWMI